MTDFARLDATRPEYAAMHAEAHRLRREAMRYGFRAAVAWVRSLFAARPATLVRPAPRPAH